MIIGTSPRTVEPGEELISATCPLPAPHSPTVKKEALVFSVDDVDGNPAGLSTLAVLSVVCEHGDYTHPQKEESA